MDDNYYGEMAEVFLAVKCKTRPIMATDSKGNSVEDKTRTNVCMPTRSLVVRKNVARLTANSPNIKFRCQNQEVAEKLNAWAYQQYDRSGEQREHRRHVMQAEMFGFSYTKLYQDSIVQNRNFRRDRSTFTDRAAYMQEQGTPHDEIDSAIKQLGPNLSPEEISQAVAEHGSEIRVPTPITKYDGPVVKCVFAGDFFMPPGVLTLNDADWWVEQYDETDLWLQKKAKVQYEDPETGQLISAFDKKKMQELLDSNPAMYDRESEPQDLRNRLRDIINQTRPEQGRLKRLIQGKKFEIMEGHEVEDDGRIWITWVANEKYQIGRMPMPWDFFGKPCYTELVMLPDLVNAWGDSTPRLMRFLHALHNAAVGQRTDLVSNLLRRTVLTRYEDDLPDEVAERGIWRVQRVKDPKAITILEEPDAPASAYEQEAQILRMEALLEPSLNTTDTGSASNPMAGKLATTAIINQKSNDALTQDKINGIEYYLKELGEKKLWMLQEIQEEPLTLDRKYVKSTGLSERYGKTAQISLDPMEIQEDIGVEPEAGSILAVDDEIKKQAAQELFILASQNPDVIDKYYAAEVYVATIPGVDVSKALLPRPSGPPPIQPRLNVGINFKGEDLPAEIVNPILQAFGAAPSEELSHRDTLKGIEQLSAAANAASNLESPASPTPDEIAGQKKIDTVAKRDKLQ
jgi:hypothetical protein